ncbi:MAG: thiamine pyrophosphate-binding protein [Actinomycetota bacterium]|nr:thiamine pyrophosphate-binding protein [Actinomycetota bacterium]
MAEFIPQSAQQDAVTGGPDGGMLMAQALKKNGIDTIFGLCGGHILNLFDACIDTGIRVIDTRHEGGATLAAEGWALATGRTGFAAVTAGPGFGNALTGFIDASIWTLPMVLFAGRTGFHQAGRGAVMDVDQRAIVAPVAKWAATCPQTQLIPRFVEESLYRARAGRPGPVYLEVPQDLFMARATPKLEPTPSGFPSELPTPTAAQDDLDKALEALEGAERPAIVAGGGAFWSGAGQAIARLAETAKIPVVTTSTARGLVPDSHPWCLGSMVHAGFALIQADVVLVLGSMFNANMNFGSQPLFGPETTIIQVDIRPEGIGGNRLPQIALIGDVRRVAEDLADGWRKSVAGRDEWLAQARTLCAASVQLWDAQIEGKKVTRIHAGAMARDMRGWARERIGDGVTWVADGGDALTWALAYAYAEAPGRLLSTTTALGTLGVGLPFALAAKAARPEEPVIAVIGDGSFGLTAMEFDTAVRHKLPVICVVSNNYGWRDVSHEQDMWHGEGRRIASELGDTRYDKLAEMFGGHGEHVETLDQLRPALDRALDSGLASIVNVQTDPEVLSELLRNVGQLGLM